MEEIKKMEEMTDKQAKALAGYCCGILPDMSDPEIASLIQPYIDTDREIQSFWAKYLSLTVDREITRLPSGEKRIK